MAKKPTTTTDLTSLQAERTRLEALLADIMEREKAAREAERDAGRPALLAAIGKVKIAALSRPDAKTIAQALANHGGSKVAAALAQLD